MLRETVAALRGHDLALYAAGVTFYAAVALVPSLLVALWGLTLLLGDPRVTQYAERLAGALPTALDAPAGAEALLDAATRLAPTTALIALVPASMYGEGLRRAFARLVPGGEGVGDSGPGASWRGRLRLLPLFAVTPLLVLLVLGVTPLLDELFSSGGAGRTLLGVYLAFLADWLAVSVPLTYVYRVVGPATPSWRAAAWGGFATGSCIAGFVQGFVLFLALPLDVARPFGGFRGIALGVVVCLWLWLLHLLVLVGYSLAMRVDARGGVPWRSRPPPAAR